MSHDRSSLSNSSINSSTCIISMTNNRVAIVTNLNTQLLTQHSLLPHSIIITITELLSSAESTTSF